MTTTKPTTPEPMSWQPHPTRREFLTYIGMLVAASACGNDDHGGGSKPLPPPTLAGDPFTVGVASGDPRSESVILWTRLAIDPLHGGGMPALDVPVIWELALSDDFSDIIRSGFVF